MNVGSTAAAAAAAHHHHNKTHDYLKDKLWEYVVKKSSSTAGPQSTALINSSSSGSLGDTKSIDALLRPVISNSGNHQKGDQESTTAFNVAKRKLAALSGRPAVNSSDSIGNEMTHFKPIRLMPISGQYTSEKAVLTPAVRYNNHVKSSIFFAPAKSKFKPEAPLKVRNSAFCLVSKPTAKKVTVAAAAAAANKRITRTVLKAQIKSTSQKQRQPLPPPAAAAAVVPASVPPPTYSVYNRNKSNEKLMCNILLEKTKCDRIVQQEKGDYELAKMLQEYDDVAVVVAAAKPPAAVKNGKSTKLNGCTAKRTAAADIDLAMPSTRRYFLRSRSKAETATAAVDESAAAAVDVTAMKRPRPLLQNGKVHHKQVLTTTPPRTVGKRKSKSTTRK